MVAFPRVLVLFFIGMGLFFSLVTAVPGVGETENDGPTPIGGFSVFTGACPQSGFEQKVIVCTSSPCTFTTPKPLCVSPSSLSSIHSCVASARVDRWGIFPAQSACCRVSDQSCASLQTDPWHVGVFSSTLVSNVLDSVSPDWRASKMVRRANAQWVSVFTTLNGDKMVVSNDEGESWENSFLVKDLVPPSLLPSGVSFQDLVGVDSTLIESDSGIVHLAFTARDVSNGKSTIYYSRCAVADCTDSSDWSPATSIFDPAFVVDAQGEWKYKLGFPKLGVENTHVHVIVDDSEVNVAQRLSGILNKFCDANGICSSFADWTNPTAGPDILAGFSGNGYARSPSVRVNGEGMMSVVWLDNQSPGIQNPSLIYFSEYDPTTNAWGVPYALPASGNFSFPTILSDAQQRSVIVKNGSALNAWSCTLPDCPDAQGVSLPWQTNTDRFTLIDSMTNGFSDFAVMANPNNSNSFAVWLEEAGPIPRVWGYYWSPTQTAGPRELAATSTSFAGLGDYSAGHVNAQNESVHFLGVQGNEGLVFSSDILDASNTLPVVSSLIPSTPTTWQNGESAFAPYSELVSLVVRDADAQDTLYASISLGVTPGSSEHSLVSFVNLLELQNGADPTSSCTGTDFSTNQLCTIAVPLYSATNGFTAPDGVYYLRATVYDDAGGESTVFSSNPLTLDASQVEFQIDSPEGNGDAWSGQASHFYDFSITNYSFSQSFAVQVSFESSNGNVYSAGTLSVFANGVPSSGCTQDGNALNCHIPFTPPSSLAAGSYRFDFTPIQDGFSDSIVSVNNQILDFTGPALSNYTPSGNTDTIPSSIIFTLSDYSGIDISPVPSVRINNQPTSNVSCQTTNSTHATCTILTSSTIDSGFVSVNVMALDSLQNSSSESFSFTIVERLNEPDPPEVDEPLETILEELPDGSVKIRGTPFVIPNTVIETVEFFSNAVVSSAEELVDLAGPSANAIFIGLCVLAGLASDVVYRKIYTQIISQNQQQRDRVLRVALAGVFFLLPLMIGFTYPLVVGFVFAVMEIVGFVVALYAYKLFVYYETFGYKPVESPTNTRTIKR